MAETDVPAVVAVAVVRQPEQLYWRDRQLSIMAQSAHEEVTEVLGVLCALLMAEIDVMNAQLEPLRSFILPGGSALSAHLHVCRTVSRRAERLAVELATMESVNPAAIKYLNRLSDWFFVAARMANNAGRDDVLWVPGANRE